MKLSLRRKFEGPKYTIGDLSIDGTFFCNTIEDVVRELPDSCPDTSRLIPCQCEEKVYARTAIPTGTYKETLEYSPKFKRKMPYLHEVPHFLGILIHWGNTEDDSGGCIIVGENTVKGKVLNSRATFKKLFALLEKEDDITIEIFQPMAVNKLKAPRNIRIDFSPSPRQFELWKFLQPNYCPHCGAEIEQVLIGYDQQKNPQYKPQCKQCKSQNLPQLILGVELPAVVNLSWVAYG